MTFPMHQQEDATGMQIQSDSPWDLQAYMNKNINK